MRPKYIHPASVFTSDEKQQQQQPHRKNENRNKNKGTAVWQNKGQPQKLICSSPRTCCPLNTEPPNTFTSHNFAKIWQKRRQSLAPSPACLSRSKHSITPAGALPLHPFEMAVTRYVCHEWVFFWPPSPPFGIWPRCSQLISLFSCLAGTNETNEPVTAGSHSTCHLARQPIFIIIWNGKGTSRFIQGQSPQNLPCR